MVAPGLFLVPMCDDSYLNEQMHIILVKFKDSMQSLKNCYKHVLKTEKEYANSIVKNEDGFFLRLYQFIRECQIIMKGHLK